MMHRRDQREIVRQSLPALLAKGEAFAGEFHRRLFESRPELLPLFPQDAKARQVHLERMLELVQQSVADESDPWRASTSETQDPLLVLAQWCRPDGPLHQLPDHALEDAGLAFVDAVSATLDDCSAEQRIALSQTFDRFAQAQQVLTQCKVHASDIEDEDGALLLSAPLDQTLALPSLLETLSLCQQPLQLSFFDAQEQSTGSLYLKSGQVLQAECQQEGGQPAFRLLVARPHHQVRVARCPLPQEGPLVGDLFDLVGESSPALPGLLVVDPSRLAANREPLAEAEMLDRPSEGPASVYDDAPELDVTPPGVPTPVNSVVPMDTQPIDLDVWTNGPSARSPFRPADLVLSRLERPWTPALSRIPHLRALILLGSQTGAQGTYWQRAHADLSISDLSRFGQAILWAQAQAQLFGDLGGQQGAGWTHTTEHALGCVVTTLDAQGKMRIGLFESDAPLGKVRHTMEKVIAYSDADLLAFGA